MRRDDARVRALTHQSAALLLHYPDDELAARLPLLAEVTAALPGVPGALLRGFVAHAQATPLSRLAADYVATFDLQRRCALHLTYYVYGDTRKRGMALLRCRQAFRVDGFDLADGELPDHLPAVLELSAAGSREAVRLLKEYRVGIELLHLALTEMGSPWRDVVDAVRATLPEPAPRDLARAMELARTGPPEEDVGLEPFLLPDPAEGRR